MNCVSSQLAHHSLHNHFLSSPLACLWSPLFVSCPLSLSAEVFVNFHLGQHIITAGPRCLLVQLTPNPPGDAAPENHTLHFSLGVQRSLRTGNRTYLPSGLMTTQIAPRSRNGHMTLVIQLVTESAPNTLALQISAGKIQSRRLSLSTGAFPASCSVDPASLWQHVLLLSCGPS